MINFIGLYIFLVFVLAAVSARKNIAAIFTSLDQSSSTLRFVIALFFILQTVNDVSVLLFSAPLYSGTFGFVIGLPKLFLDSGVLIWTHEAGHAALSWAGRFIHIFGGTLFQIGVPLSLAIACKRKRYITAWLIALWISGAASLLCVPYVWDASKRALPLLGISGNEGHDWGNLLEMTGLLGYESSIGWLFLIAGVGLECFSIFGLLMFDQLWRNQVSDID